MIESNHGRSPKSKVQIQVTEYALAQFRSSSFAVGFQLVEKSAIFR
jgi:hypothetical protein